MASGPIDIPVGAVVDISLGRGVVRFFGTTSFSLLLLSTESWRLREA